MGGSLYNHDNMLYIYVLGPVTWDTLYIVCYICFRPSAVTTDY